MKKILLFLCIVVFNPVLYSQNMATGMKMMQYQRYQSAIREFTAAISQNSSDINASYWLGIALIKNKNIDKAVAHFKKTLQETKAPLLNAGLANAYAAAGKTHDAVTILSAIKNNADGLNDAELFVAIGRAYAELREFEKAGSYYDRAIALNKSNLSNYILAAGNAIRQGDGTAAYRFLNTAKSIDSNYAPVYYWLAKIYISQKAAAVYLPLLKQAIQKDSSFTPAWYEMYKHAYYNDKGNVKKYYARYLDLSDKTDKEEYKLIMLDYDAKKYKSVIERSKKMLGDEENDFPVEIYRIVAFSYYKTGDIPMAYTNMMHYMEVQDSARIKSNDLYLIAQYAARLKEKDSTAIDFISRAYDDDTTASNRKYYAATLVNHFIKTNDRYNITAWREKLLPYKNYDKMDMYNIVVAWFDQDELERSDSVLQKFVERYPKEYKAIYMQAGIKSKLDSTMQTGEAVPYYEDFISKANDKQTKEYQSMLLQSYSYLGNYYLAKKDFAASLKNYSGALKYDPQNRDLKKTIADIKKYQRDIAEYRKKKDKEK